MRRWVHAPSVHPRRDPRRNRSVCGQGGSRVGRLRTFCLVASARPGAVPGRSRRRRAGVAALRRCARQLLRAPRRRDQRNRVAARAGGGHLWPVRDLDASSRRSDVPGQARPHLGPDQDQGGHAAGRLLGAGPGRGLTGQRPRPGRSGDGACRGLRLRGESHRPGRAGRGSGDRVRRRGGRPGEDLARRGQDRGGGPGRSRDHRLPRRGEGGRLAPDRRRRARLRARCGWRRGSRGGQVGGAHPATSR